MKHQAAFLALCSVLLFANTAFAGGFFLAARGTRPLTRGGAYVAGVDDPHALWYNPAGLAYSENQFLFDGTLTLFRTDYTRIDSGGTELPTITGYHPYIPIPTIGASYRFADLPQLTFGAAFVFPNAAMMEWPQDLEANGFTQPAPQRYSLLNLRGSILGSLSMGVAWRPIDELSIGAAVDILAGNFISEVALSACDGVVCSFPEDPDYDAVTQLTLPVLTALGRVGFIYDAGFLRIGASATTLFSLTGTGDIRVRPPTAAAYQSAEVVNRSPDCDYANADDPCRQDTKVDIEFPFPWIFRFGIEVRPIEGLEIEAAVVWETWSVQDAVRIQPRNVWIEDALGFLNYEIGPLDIPRNGVDTISIRLGGTYHVSDTLSFSLGGYYENGAFPDATLSALTIDSDKILVGGGIAFQVAPELTFDLLAGYLHLFPRQVRNSIVPIPNPIRPAPLDAQGNPRYVIANGDYSMIAPFAGAGLRYRFDAPAPLANDEESGQDATSPTEAPWYQRAPNASEDDAAPSQPSSAEPETNR